MHNFLMLNFDTNGTPYENSNNITSGILYNQFLIDRDSCSDIVGYFYDVAPR